MTLDSARDAMNGGDYEAAAGLIRAAELHAPEAGELLEAEQVARIWLYRGMLAHAQGSHDALAMDIWRQALVVDDEIQWDDLAYENPAAQGLFEALRAEVRGRPKVSVQHPEAVGAARLHVDGRRVGLEDTVREGIHLAQIECPEEQGMFGAWTDFDRRFRWLEMCPEGVDVTAVVAEVEEEDDFGDFGPSFGAAVATADVSEPLPPAPLQPTRRKISTPMLIGAGGAALVSGGMYLSALQSRARFDDLSASSELQTAADVSALRTATNTRVYLSAGTGVLAVGLYTAAFIQF